MYVYAFLQLLLLVDSICSCLPGVRDVYYVMWTAKCATLNMSVFVGVYLYGDSGAAI